MRSSKLASTYACAIGSSCAKTAGSIPSFGLPTLFIIGSEYPLGTSTCSSSISWRERICPAFSCARDQSPSSAEARLLPSNCCFCSSWGRYLEAELWFCVLSSRVVPRGWSFYPLGCADPPSSSSASSSSRSSRSSSFLPSFFACFSLFAFSFFRYFCNFRFSARFPYLSSLAVE